MAVNTGNAILHIYFRFSGITEDDLRDITTDVFEARELVKNFVKEDTILIGHGLITDLFVLKVRTDFIVYYHVLDHYQ